MSSNLTILIPSRIGSTRLSNKPLVEIHGISLIQRVFLQASKLTDDVYIATDSSLIENHVKNFTNNVVMTSESHISGTDRVCEAAKILNLPDNRFIINLQGDEPFVPTDLLELIQNDFNKNTCDVITASQKITNMNDLQNPNCVKVHTTNNYADDFQRICKVNAENTSHHLGIYGYRLSTLNKLVELTPTERELELKLEQLRFMDNNFSIYVSSYKDHVHGGIDTQEDVDNAISYLKNQ